MATIDSLRRGLDLYEASKRQEEQQRNVEMRAVTEWASRMGKALQSLDLATFSRATQECFDQWRTFSRDCQKMLPREEWLTLLKSYCNQSLKFNPTWETVSSLWENLMLEPIRDDFYTVIGEHFSDLMKDLEKKDVQAALKVFTFLSFTGILNKIPKDDSSKGLFCQVWSKFLDQFCVNPQDFLQLVKIVGYFKCNNWIEESDLARCRPLEFYQNIQEEIKGSPSELRSFLISVEATEEEVLAVFHWGKSIDILGDDFLLPLVVSLLKRGKAPEAILRECPQLEENLPADFRAILSFLRRDWTSFKVRFRESLKGGNLCASIVDSLMGSPDLGREQVLLWNCYMHRYRGSYALGGIEESPWFSKWGFFGYLPSNIWLPEGECPDPSLGAEIARIMGPDLTVGGTMVELMQHMLIKIRAIRQAFQEIKNSHGPYDPGSLQERMARGMESLYQSQMEVEIHKLFSAVRLPLDILLQNKKKQNLTWEEFAQVCDAFAALARESDHQKPYDFSSPGNPKRFVVGDLSELIITQPLSDKQWDDIVAFLSHVLNRDMGQLELRIQAVQEDQGVSLSLQAALQRLKNKLSDPVAGAGGNS